MQGLMQDWPLRLPQGDRSCRALSRRPGSRDADGGGTDHAHHLQGHSSEGAQGRTGADETRHEGRRRRRHHGLEHGAPSGGLVRHHGDGRCLPHAEPAPLRRAARLHHQSRRGQARLPRPDLRADPRGDRGQAAQGEGLCHHDGQGPHAGNEAAERALLRGNRGSRGRQLQMGGSGRERRLRPLLHLGHDGQSEGRALFAPFQRAAFDGGQHGRRARHEIGGRDPAGGADVPCERLGHRLRGARRRREDRDARRQHGRREHLRTSRQGAGDGDGGGADRSG